MSDSQLDEIGKVAASLGGRLLEVPLSDIEFFDRGRKDFGDLNELALSLKTLGQLQNLVLISTPDASKPYRGLAGERRFRAMTQKLNWEKARALIFDHDLTEIELLEIEFDENKRRKNLSWDEECLLKTRIHNLRVEKFGGIKITPKANAPGTSLRETAKTLEISPASLSLDIKVGKAIAERPELFEGCDSKKEAIKRILIAEEMLIRNELTKRAQLRGVSNQVQKILNCFQVCDFFEGINTIPDSSIDLVEIDPPYAVDLMDLHTIKSGASESDYTEVDANDYLQFMKSVLQLCYRKMKPNSWLLLWHATKWAHDLFHLAANEGLVGNIVPAVWTKPTGSCNAPRYYLGSAYEPFFYLRKGDPAIVKMGRPNVFHCTPVTPDKKIHPTERPLDLMKEILSTFTFEGSMILVPFLGSGNTIIAANELSMNAFGFELHEQHKTAFTQRVIERFEKL